jgi:hypothetical protein
MEVSSLGSLVVGPHADDFHDMLVIQDLIDQPVPNVDPMDRNSSVLAGFRYRVTAVWSKNTKLLEAYNLSPWPSPFQIPFF